MLNDWVNPFGAAGIRISSADLKLKIGWYCFRS